MKNEEKLINNFSEERVLQFFQSVCEDFRLGIEDDSHLFKEEQKKTFEDLQTIGTIEFNNFEKIIVCTSKIQAPLTERTSKRTQYELARTILKDKKADGGLFFFHDEKGRFRFSFVRIFYTGAKRELSTYKRYSFFVDPTLSNKTFKQQIGKAKFSSLNSIQKTF